MKSLSTFGCLAALTLSHVAVAALEWRIVAPRTTYNIREGIVLRVPVFLEERVTGTSTSLLVQQQGVFSVGVQVSRLSGPSTAPCELRRPLPAEPETLTFFDFDEGPFAAISTVNATGSQGTLGVFSRGPTTTGVQVSPGVRRVRVGEFFVAAGTASQTVTTFRLGDPSNTTDTLLWGNNQVIDNVTISTTIAIQVLPGCDSIDINRNGVFPEDRDVIDFFNVLAGAPCPYAGDCDLDFDNNGVFPEDEDVITFFRVLAGGDC